MMAADLQQGLSCPVCLEVFRDPVLLPCTHSFCRECVRRTVGGSCPVCRLPYEERHALSNRALGEACESFLNQNQHRDQDQDQDQSLSGSSAEGTCNLHLKVLKFYCEKDEEPLCEDCVCLHSTHRLLPLRDALPRCQNELRFKLQIFEQKKETYQKKSLKFIQAVDHIKGQAALVETQIREEFQRLHELLHLEERVRLQAVTNEQEQKVAALNQLIDATNKDVIALDQLINSVRRDMDDTDMNILRNFQSFKRNAQWTSREPRLLHDALLNVAKHVGALGFNIWRNLQSHVTYYPVVLNPNSASPWLSLSDDLTSMKEGSERMAVPENPERFDPCVFVVGAEGYASGRHKWEVTVSDSPRWVLGVCKESVIRKKKFTLSPKRGVWAMSLSKGVYHAMLAERQQLEVAQRPERIRIKLDMDKGEVSFYDGDTSSHLATLTHRFDERMFPIFGPALYSKPMTLAPGKMTLHT